MNQFLAGYAQPLVARADNFQYFIPEIYWHPLFEMAQTCGYQLREEVKNFHLQPQPTPWPLDEDIDVPSFTDGGTELRPYQIPAVRRLIQGNLLLGDDMGLGKTLSVIHAWRHIGRHKLVVVVPNDDVAGDWFQCIDRHFGGDIEANLVTSRKVLEATADSMDVLLIPYSKVWRAGYFEVLLGLMPGCILVFDEGHRVSRAASNQHQGCYQLALQAVAVWVMSGTEVSNTPDQYYGMYKLVRRPTFEEYKHTKPEMVTEKAWVSYYRDVGARNQWHTTRLGNLRTLRESFALRRTKEEVQPDLPPLTIETCGCTLDPVTRKIYRDLETECEAELMRQGNPEVLKEEHFWTIYLRLIQLCSHPMLLGEERVPVPNKWERCEQIIEECSGAQQIGIWSNFPRTIEWIATRIREHFPWLRVETAHGEVGKEDRARIKEGVQQGEVDVVVANPAIWSEGVNLQAISCGIYWDYHPSLVRWKQSQSRFHRMGQTKAVSLYLLAYRNSIDMKLLDWLQEKGRLSRLITGQIARGLYEQI